MSFGFWAGFWIVTMAVTFYCGKRWGSAAFQDLAAERDELLAKLRSKL